MLMAIVIPVNKSHENYLFFILLCKTNYVNDYEKVKIQP